MLEIAGVCRRQPVGAEVIAGRGVHFRVWAPDHRAVSVVPERNARSEGTGVAEVALAREGADGYFSGFAPAASGDCYWLRLDDSSTRLPDPASRFQPDGPHGPSQVVDPSSYQWGDADWDGVAIPGQVIYEMHVGTFTPQGTWAAAARELEELRRTGITVVEVMPVADFPGRFGWGYDGVDLFAPARLYGQPDDFRRFVDRAHALGLGVILDVVYNHVGPDGACLKEFAGAYFTDRYENEWGAALNFDGEGSAPVREFFLANASYWIDEYHLDGLRLDATQSIHDRSADHIVAAIARGARAAAGRRSIILVAENESQTSLLVRSGAEGGYGLDAVWNDDYHHSAVVALTGKSEAYYTDYLGLAQEFVSAAKHGYLYQGQHYAWQKQDRGTPTWGLPPWAFVSYLENHDQLANSLAGLRLHQRSQPGCYRALMALTLLGPATPMLFQGQEFAASSPFLFFADHRADLAKAVRSGRFEFLSQFSSIGSESSRVELADPSSAATFERCRLDFRERETHRAAYDLTRDLLRLRREDPVLRQQGSVGIDGAVLGPSAFVLRFFSGPGHEEDRVLMVNLGRDLPLRVAPEPLLAPPAGRRWDVRWSSDDPRYGGAGIAPVVTADGVRVPGQAAVLLAGVPSAQR